MLARSPYGLEKVIELNKMTTYSYDKAGNRKTEIVLELGQATGTNYIYDIQNRLILTETKLTEDSVEKIVYTYDPNGNLRSKVKNRTQTKDDKETENQSIFGLEIVKENNGTGSEDITIYEYDNYNRLIKVKEGNQTSSYKYNAEDYRVEKTVGTSTTLYLYEADKVVLETDSNGNQRARNVYGTNLLYRKVETEQSYEEYYYLYNAHGDVTALISPNGEVEGTYNYDAFGNITSQTGSVDNSITYAGYQYDEETKLYYLNARYYDSKIARFLTEDTYTGNPSDPLSLNLYTYCHNEPIMYIDPTGHWEEGDSKRSAEAQAQILEATNEYYEAQKRGDTDAMDAAHGKAEAARKGSIYKSKSYTKRLLKEEYDFIYNSEYIDKSAKLDMYNSRLKNIFDEKKNKYNLLGDDDLLNINLARRNSNIIDPKLNYSLLNKINTLSNLARNYAGEDGNTNLLVSQYIRQFNKSYTIPEWDMVGGNIDTGFNNFVQKWNPQIAEYFGKSKDYNINIVDPNYNKIEITHFMVTLSALFYSSSWEDGRNIKNSVKAQLMPEYHIDDLGGWAGDLQTLMLDVIKEKLPDTYESNYNKFTEFMGVDRKSFSIKDLYADVDAVNINKMLNSPKKIGEILKEYYTNSYNIRYTSFVKNLTGKVDKKEFSNRVNLYTNSKYFIFGWPLLGGQNVSNNQQKAFKDAFVNFIWNKVQYEK